ncbi:DNA-3-methyladenine glycosylase [Oscillibacter sp. MSJ-2]|uniref:Putative 3-methyladenine DNA glycosylase n=1 Tax=Dysosmobacter acutus TaxID=2841504 RepID=A0ABS6FB71_9FIRM|nr:DNA-3-methyladenine glycosylase [Dysosmobacter acutus]MBU5627328.1 DNA-3-methyladenine glycosylase [Dysosmobacter acutus]
MAILHRKFYSGDTVETARALLGKYLVRIRDGEPLVCRITETETYVGRMDKACHAYGYRRTPRTETLFGPPGHAYIYLIYGMYHCLNFVTEPEGEPAAVLIRGLSPVWGEQTIRRLRFGAIEDKRLSAYQRKNFLNGPGKVCKGLSLTKLENGLDLTAPPLFVCDRAEDAGVPGDAHLSHRIHVSKRIGIDYAEEAVDFPWRFYLEEKE